MLIMMFSESWVYVIIIFPKGHAPKQHQQQKHSRTRHTHTAYIKYTQHNIKQHNTTRQQKAVARMNLKYHAHIPASGSWNCATVAPLRRSCSAQVLSRDAVAT